MTWRAGSWLLAGASAAVAATLVWALVVLDSPAEHRRRQLDERTVMQLQALENSLSMYMKTHDALPADLNELQREGLGEPPRDPESNAAYNYRVLDAGHYELCAEFRAATPQRAPGAWPGALAGEWRHGAGHQCFRRAVQTHGDAGRGG